MTKKRTIIAAISGLAAVIVIGIAYFGVNAAVNNPARLLSLGERYLLEMDYEQAVVYFERLIKIDPKNARAYIGLAKAYEALGQTDQAIEILRLGVERTGDNAVAAYLASLDSKIVTATPQGSAPSITIPNEGSSDLTAIPSAVASVHGSEPIYESTYRKFTNDVAYEPIYREYIKENEQDLRDYSQFFLYDMDSDGTPEFIAMEDMYRDRLGSFGNVYAIKDSSIALVGEIFIGNESMSRQGSWMSRVSYTYSNDKSFPGLFVNAEYTPFRNGSFTFSDEYCNYYALIDEVITVEKVATNLLDRTNNVYASWHTDDQSLFAASQSIDKYGIRTMKLSKMQNVLDVMEFGHAAIPTTSPENVCIYDVDGFSVSEIEEERIESTEELDLQDHWVFDIKQVDRLTGLTKLRLNNNPLSNIDPLKGLTNLTYLWLNSDQISDIRPLEGLENLSELRLDGNRISDIGALKGLKNLTTLWLNNNRISDISALVGLSNLTKLYLYKNQISDISSLRGLTGLTELWLNENSIADIGALEGLTNLTKLYLGNNQFNDVSVLKRLTNLTDLSLYGIPISEEQLAELQAALPNCSISY